MAQLVQTIINGISIGATYTLIGLGLTVIYSVFRLLNLAHGEFYMLGAYVSFFFITVLEVPFFISIVISMIVIGLVGLVVERLVIRPLQDHAESDILIATIGLLFFLENLALFFFKPVFRSISNPIPAESVVRFAGQSISGQRLMVFVITVILVVILHYFNSRTKIGKQMRSVAQDKETSQLMGINVKLIGQVAFFLGCALAALAGTLMGSLQTISPDMGFNPLLYGMVVVILGGLGSNVGAIVGGLLIGVTQSLTVTYLPSGITDIIVYSILFLALMLKPTGLFGGKVYG